MTESILCSIIGIVGSLLGVVLGWILNALSKKGKLHFYVSNLDYQFVKEDGYGGFINGSNIDESTNFNCNLSLDIYNSSGDILVMRNVQIIFQKKEEVIWKHSPYDKCTMQSCGAINTYDEVQPTNVVPKSVYKIELFSLIESSQMEFNRLIDTDCVYLSYLDRSNKEKKIMLSKMNLNDFFNKEKSV